MMPLFLLEINSNNTKQIQYYVSIPRPRKVLAGIENHAYFLVLENVAEC